MEENKGEELKVEDIDKKETLDEDENVTAEVFDEGANKLVEESKESDFVCNNPQNRGGHIAYTCKGVDKKGQWEGLKRYSQFDKLS